MFQFIYWNKGATELATGKKTLTLKQFEKKYSEKFINLAKEYKDKNVWAKYKSLSEAEQNDPNLINALKQLDVNVNINWPLVHYKSAVRLEGSPKSSGALVEPRGVEPLTFSLRTRRSTN